MMNYYCNDYYSQYQKQVGNLCGDKNQHKHNKVCYNYHYFKEQVGMIQNINQMVEWVSTIDGFNSCG